MRLVLFALQLKDVTEIFELVTRILIPASGGALLDQ